MTLARRALERLEAWPDLTVVQASCGTGRALRTSRNEIVHFHSDHEVDLHLTNAAIQRFSGDLERSTAIRLVPGSRWVTIHLDCDTDVDLLASLVSVALQAHDKPAPAGAVPLQRCNFHHVTVLPREKAP
jgi:luciferase-like monooxygenase